MHEENEQLLSSIDKDKVKHIEEYVKSMLVDIDPEHLQIIADIDALNHRHLQLVNKTHKKRDEALILQQLCKTAKETSMNVLLSLKPFANLTNSSYSSLNLWELLNLDETTTKIYVEKALSMLYTKVKSESDCYNEQALLVEQDIKTKTACHAGDNFLIINNYYSFKKIYGYTFDIDSKGNLQKISKKGSGGPQRSVVYLQNETQDKIVLFSGARDLLGKGTYGTVKKAQFYNCNDLHACKIQSTHKSGKSMVSAIDAEVESLNKVGLFKAGGTLASHGKNYTSMKLVKGEDFFVVVLSENNPDACLNLMVQAAKALQALHTKDLIHRDVKFENFIYDGQTNKCTLIDFAFLLAVSGDEPFLHNNFCGSEDYLAPEISIERDAGQLCCYSKRSDIYAFGVMLEMVQEKLPDAFKDNYNAFKADFESRPKTLEDFIREAEKFLKEFNAESIQTVATSSQVSASIQNVQEGAISSPNRKKHKM